MIIRRYRRQRRPSSRRGLLGIPFPPLGPHKWRGSFTPIWTSGLAFGSDRCCSPPSHQCHFIRTQIARNRFVSVLCFVLSSSRTFSSSHQIGWSLRVPVTSCPSLRFNSSSKRPTSELGQQQPPLSAIYLSSLLVASRCDRKLFGTRRFHCFVEREAANALECRRCAASCRCQMQVPRGGEQPESFASFVLLLRCS